MSRVKHIFQYAIASLKNHLSFVITVVTTLSFTIGALLCILTIGYIALLQPLPYPDDDKLHVLQHGFIEKDGTINNRAYPYPTLMHIYQHQQSFERSALISYASGVLTSHAEQPSVPTTYVSPEYFELLKPTMAKGRGFVSSESVNEYNQVAVISFQSWQQEFNGDPNILEQTLSLNGTSFRIIGVLSNTFVEPEIIQSGRHTHIYLPWDYNQVSTDGRNNWRGFNWNNYLLVKEKNDLTAKQAALKLSNIISPLWQEQVSGVAFFNGWDVKVESQQLKDIILGDGKRTILLLLASITGLVFIAVGNIINLYLSRMSKQSRKLTILASIGVNKKSLFQLIWAESFIVMTGACMIALLLAQLGFTLSQNHLSAWLPRTHEIALNSFTITVAIALLLLLSTLFAYLCVNLIDYRKLAHALKESGKGTGIQISAKTRATFVSSQVAIATTLVFFNLIIWYQAMSTMTKPLGFEVDNISALELSVASHTPLSRDELKPSIQLVRKNIENLPQVKSVSLNDSPFRVMSQWVITDINTNESYSPQGKVIDSNYFSMINQPLVQGRYFTEEEVKNRQKLMIINEAFANRLAQDGPVIGAKLTSGSSDYFQVIGVVKNRSVIGQDEIPFRVHSPTHGAYTRFLIETYPDQSLTRKQIVDVTQSSDRLLSVYSYSSLAAIKSGIVFADKVAAISTAILSLLSFLLAAIGLYGIFSFSMQIRTFELGTRLAIGARRKDIIRLISNENIRAITTGIAVSLALTGGIFLFLGEHYNLQVTLENMVSYSLAACMVVIVSWLSCIAPLHSIINKPVTYSLRG